MPIQSIKDVVQGRSLSTIEPSATVQQACDRMAAENIGALAVMSDGALVGILSERDLITRSFATGKGGRAMTAAQVMTPHPVTMKETSALADALGVMLDGGFRHLPITNAKGVPVAMLSMRDIPTEYRLMVERYRSYMAPAMAAQ